ncbi:MAG: VRR-NUC domain-containing protein [Phycisphaerae bacterium]|nr:VRR-NUC domain-containing protein [Phycisphaerae bacterium]
MAIKLTDLSDKVLRRIAAQEKRKADAREYLHVGDGTYRLERDLVRDALVMLADMDVYCWRNNSGAAGTGGKFVRFGLKGSADILGVLDPSGRFLAIECKAKGKTTTPHQDAFLVRIRQAGGIAGAVWSLADIRRLIVQGENNERKG